MRRSHRSHLPRTLVSSLLAVAVVLGLAPSAYPTLVPCTPDPKVPCTPEVPEVPCWLDPDPPCKLCPADLPCQTLVKNSSQLTVPLACTPSSSVCIPPGTYISGYLNIRTSFIQSTCGTRTRTETATCNAKIFVPGVGVFTSKEVTFDDARLGPTGSETTSYASFRYRRDGCHESYRLDLKIKTVIKIDPCDPTTTQITHTSESAHIDCYVPCCGDPD